MRGRTDIVASLRHRLACPKCHTSASWRQIGRSDVRVNSTIYHLRCDGCGERIVAKVNDGDGAEVSDKGLRREYEILGSLQHAYPQDHGCAVLTPITWFNDNGREILVTRYFPGCEFSNLIHGSGQSRLKDTCRLVGLWLRKLHDAGSVAPGSLGTVKRMLELKDAYQRALESDKDARNACALLDAVCDDLEGAPCIRVRLHGDFKPGNVLLDDRQCVGIDIHWKSMGTAEYDLAPFLNHLWFAVYRSTSRRTVTCYDLAERAFLAGYGYVGAYSVLRWVQLYFVLCHFGDYRQRGWLHALYAHWKIRPLMGRVRGQLAALAAEARVTGASAPQR